MRINNKKFMNLFALGSCGRASLTKEKKEPIPAFTQCAHLVSRLHTIAASVSRLTPHAVLYSLFS